MSRHQFKRLNANSNINRLVTIQSSPKLPSEYLKRRNSSTSRTQITNTNLVCTKLSDERRMKTPAVVLKVESLTSGSVYATYSCLNGSFQCKLHCSLNRKTMNFLCLLSWYNIFTKTLSIKNNSGYQTVRSASSDFSQKAIQITGRCQVLERPLPFLLQ